MGDIVSVIDMPPKVLSTWWRGKHGFQVGNKEFGVENSKNVFSFNNICVYSGVLAVDFVIRNFVCSGKKNVEDVRLGFPFLVNCCGRSPLLSHTVE